MLPRQRFTASSTAALAAMLVCLAALPGAANARSADTVDTAVVAASTTTTQPPHSPDALDAARAAVATQGVDHRSPDAVDAATAAEAAPSADLRSPEAHIVAASDEAYGVRENRLVNGGRAVALAPPARATAGEPRGSDWEDAGLVAGGIAFVILIGLGVALSTGRSGALRGPRSPAHSR